MVFFLFFTINMAPKTNSIVSDFWRCQSVQPWEYPVSFVVLK